MSVFLEEFVALGTGRRPLDDELFKEGDSICSATVREGVFDIDEDDLYHELIASFSCTSPACNAKFDSVAQFEMHFNNTHRYICSECRRSLPSSHLLDLHITETHDSFFKVQAQKKPMYQCYVEGCVEKFADPLKRRSHCISVHKFPHDFKFDDLNRNKTSVKLSSHSASDCMEVDLESGSQRSLSERKSKNQRGKKWHQTSKGSGRKTTVDVQSLVKDLQDSLSDIS